MFNIYLNDIFFFVEDSKIANWADDDIPYAIEDNIEKLLRILEKDTNIIINWFQSNEMKSNSDKGHLIVVNGKDETKKLGDKEIVWEKSVKLLGVIIDNNEHVSSLCKKANQKLHALARISKYLSTEKLRTLMEAIIDSQFNYCLLIWMFHSRQLNNKINKLHERALRTVHMDPTLNFEQLLNLDKSVCIHHRNLQRLSIEMYKIKEKLAPIPVQEPFLRYENEHNLRNQRVWADIKC